MPSFDIVSEINNQEADNAVNQTLKEIEGRYDFKGSKSKLDWDKKEIILTAEDDYKIGAMKDILQTKFHRRGIDIRALNYGKLEEVGGQMLKQKITLNQGIDKEKAKDITTYLRDLKLKIQPQVVDDKVRVTSKSIDTLQETMSFLRTKDFGIPLQFNNIRS
jgi:uncharacterized protein YajQ (UPF0234 family)